MWVSIGKKAHWLGLNIVHTCEPVRRVSYFAALGVATFCRLFFALAWGPSAMFPKPRVTKQRFGKGSLVLSQPLRAESTCTKVGLRPFASQAFSGSRQVEIACKLGSLGRKEQFLWLEEQGWALNFFISQAPLQWAFHVQLRGFWCWAMCWIVRSRKLKPLLPNIYQVEYNTLSF